MKKLGFTLAEVLIAIGIVGVCAAFLTPTIVNIMPDRNKPRVIQYFSYITNATVDLLGDEGIYYQDDVTETVTLPEEDAYGQTEVTYPKMNPDGSFVKSCSGGLDCTSASKGRFCENASGTTKYRTCLYDRLGMNKDSDTSTFKDGSLWTVTNNGGDNYTISIKVNTNGNDCTYNKTSCKHPNKYLFSVDKHGTVKPADPLSKVYLKNSGRTNSKKDKEEASGS